MTQRLPVADPHTVEAYARELVAKPGNSRVLALAADPDYRGPRSVRVEGAEVQVRACVSSLAIREALVDLPADGYAIVLTDRSPADLGDSLIARFRRQRIEPLDSWATVPGLFRAAHVDTGLRQALPWLPEILYARLPAGGYPPSATDLVTRDHVLGVLAGDILGLPADEIGLGAVLDRLGDLRVRSDWSALSDLARDAISAWVGQRAGQAAAAALVLAAAPSTAHVDVMSLGLLFDVLYGSDPVPPHVQEARRSWENGYRLPRVAPVAAAQIGSASRARMRLLGDTDPAARHPVWRDTPEAFAIAAFPAGIELSLNHPDGYRARLGALADELVEALAQPDQGQPDQRARIAPLEGALLELRSHDLAWADHLAETERAEMAVRLVRWLASAASAGPGTLGEALTRQMADDGWVDRAVADVWSGSTHAQSAKAYQSLCDRVLGVRREHDGQFAALLVDVTGHEMLDPGLLPVEQVLVAAIEPLSRVAPVLMIVIDGMSTGVAVAVADGISRLAWTEHVPAGGTGTRGTLLAALPTMTRFSRTSLLCGGLREGTQVEEKREFARLTGSRVFHKDDLRAPAGSAVNPEVAAAIASTDRVVGVVLNTVDDTLAKHDPDGTRWSVSTIQHLEPLLEVARQHGRTVVLVSDHGHVVERGGRADLRELADARWRPAATGPAGEGEVVLTGPRVLAAGGAIVAAWVEDLRYGRKAAGYHGGASAAEVTIPLLVFASSGVD
ncbi:MAG: BREX-2 system phosphatase PglZ, partial [Candidatus Nanopelagicales bacterium]